MDAIVSTVPHFAERLRDDAELHSLLLGAFGNSPYLTRLGKDNVGFLAQLPDRPPEAVFFNLCRHALAVGQSTDRAHAATRLRELKQQAGLLIALADIGGVWPLSQTYRAWSHFADAALRGAVNHLTRAAGETRSPLAVLAMGKYGARELNYSSDIDLVLLYDDARGIRAEQAINMARDLVALMEKRDVSGYVFRTDLRLRPDPGVTAAAVPLSAAIAYYESFGQHWERAAYIRARPAAGDRKTAAEFLHHIQPFIWRKYLDYAVAQDMHAMKRQIHADSRRRTPLAGRDVKRGPGGIREIEFFVQTQQLILGGRDKALRRAGTVAMLGRLKARGWIDAQCARDMIEAYRFWRTLEHRLQMVDDAQTHALPASAQGVEHIACFMGMENGAALGKAIDRHAKNVAGHYQALFADSPSLAANRDNLVFTGGEDDPRTLDNLRQMGFAQPEAITSAVRSWHSGRLRATRSARAREELTLLLPVLLPALAKTSDKASTSSDAKPDRAFARFTNFVEMLPAGVQFFAMLRARPELLELIALICRAAPNLAQALARYPAQLEILMERRGGGSGVGILQFSRALAEAGDYEEGLNHARRWAREQRFATSAALLGGTLNPALAARHYAMSAQACLRALASLVAGEVRRRSGRHAGKALAPVIVAMGSLGARDMSAASDVDLLLLYDGGSGGGSVREVAARFAQTLIVALSAPTAEGKLYDVDMRLRPSGRSGPVAVELESFLDYQQSRAWVWEHMALTRARVIVGTIAMRRTVSAMIKEILSTRRDAGAVAKAVSDMRARLTEARDLKGADVFSLRQLRYASGGLVEIDFIAQFLQLIHAAEYPGILHPATKGALRRARHYGLLPQNMANILIEAHDLAQAGEQFGRLCVDNPLEGALDAEFAQVLAQAVGMETPHALAERLAALRTQVREIFVELIGEPVRRAQPASPQDGQGI